MKRRTKARYGREQAEIAKYLYELGLLKRVRRSGWWVAGIEQPESVAEHSFRAAAIAYFIAQIEGADPGKALAMALFHDATETRTGDLHRLAQSYVDSAGAAEKVAADQVGRFPRPLRRKLASLLEEARAGKTLEARIVKDADRLECLLQAREYSEQGYRVAEWIESSVKELATKGAKRLAKAALATSPESWRKRTRSAGT